MKQTMKWSILKDRSSTLLTYGFTIFIIFLFLFPILFLFSMSLKTQLDALASPPKLLFFTPTLINFIDLFVENEFIKYFFNSFIICIACVILSILLGAPFAYALSRSKNRWVAPVMFIVLVLRVIPPVSLLVPFFGVYSALLSPKKIKIREFHLHFIPPCCMLH